MLSSLRLLRKEGLLALAVVFLFGSALQARPPVVGQVTLTQAAVLDGQPVTDRTTVFSGDTLAVGEGVAVLVFGSHSQVRLGSDTVANFVKEGDVVTIQLEKGVVSISSAGDGSVKVTAADAELVPVGGFKAIGHIAMLGVTPGSLSVTAREGSLKITQPGSKPVTVTSGSTITVKTPAAAGAPAPQGGGGASGTAVGISVAASIASVVAGVLAYTAASDANTTASAASAAATAASAAATAATAAATAATTAATAASTKIGQLASDLCDKQVIPSPGAASCT